MPCTPSRRTTLLTLLAALLVGLGCWQFAGSLFTGWGSDPAHAEDGPGKGKKKKHTNRLAKETSPYLLLHAHNPVDWYPWGPEALAKAKKEKKLIFLSVGYSSCYWCHVMERESFMDEEIAKFLNNHFVCIKVDREERPDVDEIYMTCLHVYNQVTNSGRGGGWPLSMFLTPEAKPLGGFTYLPPRPDKKKGISTGFLNVCQSIQKVWKDNPDRITKSSEQLTEIVQRQLRGRPGLPEPLPGAKELNEMQDALAEEFDTRFGGFGFDETNAKRPKFPEPSNLVFLLQRVQTAPDQKAKDNARQMLVKTLDSMAAGGIWDHLGGGFHRYSTDRYWRIPHFEKMLYDNGQLASVYVEAFALTGDERYRETTQRLLEYVLAEMTGEHGAFYSALDAETDAEEGLYYVWTTEELKKHLTEEEFDLFAYAYGASGEPNFEGKHTLLLPRSLKETAETRKLPLDKLKAKLDSIRLKLMAVRKKRERPLTDTKVLTAWNGLMIRGFADAGRVLKDERYLKAAATAADVVLKELRTKEGRLLRTYSGKEAKLNGYLDDYAYLANGLIALHRATGEKRWLDAAQQLTDKQIELFWDKRDGGFFFTSSDHESLIARSKGSQDGARPAGNSVAADNLVYLGKVLKDANYLDRAEKTITARASMMKNFPLAFPRMFTALAELLEARSEAEKKPQ